MRKFPVRVKDEMDFSISFDTKESAAWYRKSWPNRNGMTLEQRPTEYGDITDIKRNGIVVGQRFDAY